jgi:hypothetical protein
LKNDFNSRFDDIYRCRQRLMTCADADQWFAGDSMDERDERVAACCCQHFQRSDSKKANNDFVLFFL